MQFSYIINANNITYNNGDILRVDFKEDFSKIKLITSLNFTFSSAPTPLNHHTIYIRWTYDVLSVGVNMGKPNITWSAWIPIFVNNEWVSGINSIYQKIIKEDGVPFDIQFKLIRLTNTNSPLTLEKIDFNFLQSFTEDIPEEIITCSTGIGYCTMQGPLDSGILINSNENLFNPYLLTDAAVKLYMDMSCAVSDMFGHCVRYFKTKPRVESADTILKEYSLFDVSDVKDIKILIPDNELPDNSIKYIPYDMDFGEAFEIHIVKSQFHLAFGQDTLPEEKDFLYFPLMDRTYVVSSAYSLKDFMAKEAYYKVSLFKWQDDNNVFKTPEISTYIDDLHINLEEILEPRTSDEMIRITKPQQNQTSVIGHSDFNRSTINPRLQIIKEDIKNYHTVISQDYYDLKTKLNENEIAINYKLIANQNLTENRAFSLWFKHKHTIKDLNEYDTLLSGYDYDLSKGHLLRMKYELNVPSQIEMLMDSTIYTFDGLPPLNQNWYFLTLNVMNEFGQIALFLWEMKSPTQKTTNLNLIYSRVLEMPPINIQGTNYKLISGSLNLTNIRIWSQSIEEEKQSIIANQYLVKDSHLALLVDNAVKPLNMSRQFMK